MVRLENLCGRSGPARLPNQPGLCIYDLRFTICDCQVLIVHSFFPLFLVVFSGRVRSQAGIVQQAQLAGRRIRPAEHDD